MAFLAKQEIERLNAQAKFISENDTVIEQVFDALGNASIRTVGPDYFWHKIIEFNINEIALDTNR